MTGAASVWVDGALVDIEAASVSPLDHGLLVGDGVFETLAVYGGVPFAWRRHHDRLRRSADGLGLAVPPDAELRAAAEAVLEANEILDGRLRVTVTGGRPPWARSAATRLRPSSSPSLPHASGPRSRMS